MQNIKLRRKELNTNVNFKAGAWVRTPSFLGRAFGLDAVPENSSFRGTWRLSRGGARPKVTRKSKPPNEAPESAFRELEFDALGGWSFSRRDLAEDAS